MVTESRLPEGGRVLAEAAMAIQIREHSPGEDLDAFIRAGKVVFAGDRAWVPPLEFDLRARLSPGKNPFFERGEVMLFTAWENGRLVGRCSAQIDHEHLRVHKDNAGFFGFFDTVDDQEVASALVGAAEKWLRDRGMSVMRGPFSLSINEETGMLVEGFDKPPVIMAPHHRDYQGRLAEGAGLVKVKDCYGWWYDVAMTPRAQKAWDLVAAP